MWVVCGLCLTARATDYYVSPAGNDNNSGTSASSPWRTIGKINGRSFAAGDRILFQGGQTFAGTIYFGADDAGTASSPIIVGSYDSGRATVSAGTGKGVSIYNTAGFHIENLIFAGAGRAGGNTLNGVEIYMDIGGATKLEYIHVDNVEVSGFGDAGVVFGSYPADASKSGFRNVRITNTVAHDNGDSGIESYGYFSASASGYAHADVYVGYCTTYNNRGIVNKGNNSGSGIVLADVDGAMIERSVSYNNGENNNHAGGGPVGIWAYDANDVTIQYNESYNNKTGTIDGGGFDLDGGVTNSVMQYNYSHDNDGYGYLLYQFSGARPFSNNVVRYNISQNDGRRANQAGILAGGGVNNTDVYNNTIFVGPTSTGSVPKGVRVDGITNFRFRNNIFITTGGLTLVDVASGQSGLVFQGNEYWSSGASFVIRWAGATYNNLAAWRSATGQERNGGQDTGLSVNPLLNNAGGGGTIGDPDNLTSLTAYQLQGASPLINAGLNLQSLFGINPGATDFYGTTLPQGAAYDVGAHEFPSGPTLPPAPTGLTATAGDARVTLSWAATAGAIGYNVKRALASGGPYAQVASVGTTTSYADTSVSNGTTYFYVVSAVNANGESANSNQASATPTAPPAVPAAPSGLSATAVSRSRIDLAWADNSGNEAGFRVERCTGAGCTNFTQIAQLGANVASYANTGLARNTTYTYRVRAYNAAGNSTYTNTASVKTPPK